MKLIGSITIAAILLVLMNVGFVTTVHAEEIKMVGTITAIELAADGKSALATLKDTTSGAVVIITVTDELTLDKFKDKRIVDGDEIRAKFDKQGDKNLSLSFKKTAGC